MVGRKVVALFTAATLGCAGCAGHLRHTTQPHPSAHENWAAVTGLPMGTMLRIEDRSGAGMIGRLIAIGPEEITVHGLSQKSFPRSEIRQILLQHVHTDWTGIGDVATGALVGGLIGGLAVPKHRWIAGTILTAAGAFTGLIVAVMKMFTTTGDVDPPKQDEILLYYTDRLAALPVAIVEQSPRTV